MKLRSFKLSSSACKTCTFATILLLSLIAVALSSLPNCRDSLADYSEIVGRDARSVLVPYTSVRLSVRVGLLPNETKGTVGDDAKLKQLLHDRLERVRNATRTAISQNHLESSEEPEGWIGNQLVDWSVVLATTHLQDMDALDKVQKAIDEASMPPGAVYLRGMLSHTVHHHVF